MHGICIELVINKVLLPIISHVFLSFRPLTFTLKSVLSLNGHTPLSTDKYNPSVDCYYFTNC